VTTSLLAILALMQTAFISSVQRDFGDVREAAARAAEAYGLRVLMAERAAAGGSPKGALLSLVRQSDVFILILGARYGASGEGQTSPTEDEFNEAVRIGLAILVFVQDCDREAHQESFLGRVRGAWAEGNLTASFTGPDDIGVQVIAALRRLDRASDLAAARPAAEQRAADLARGSDRGSFSGGALARVALAPLIEGRLLDDVSLNRAGIADEVRALMRESGVVSQRVGIDAETNGAVGIRLAGRDAARAVGFSDEAVEVTIGLDGAVSVQAPVGGEGPFGSSLVDPDRLGKLLAASGRFTVRTWSLFDTSSRISQLAAAIGLPSAEHRVYGRSTASSLSMGGMGRLPATLVVPEPPLVARREDLGTERIAGPLIAAVERRFRDAQATVGI
jgi:hypothetical protein